VRRSVDFQARFQYSIGEQFNTGDKLLRLYTLYAPPNHVDQLVQTKKSEAEASHEVFDGVTS